MREGAEQWEACPLLVSRFSPLLPVVRAEISRMGKQENADPECCGPHGEGLFVLVWATLLKNSHVPSLGIGSD